MERLDLCTGISSDIILGSGYFGVIFFVYMKWESSRSLYIGGGIGTSKAIAIGSDCKWRKSGQCDGRRDIAADHAYLSLYGYKITR